MPTVFLVMGEKRTSGRIQCNPYFDQASGGFSLGTLLFKDVEFPQPASRVVCPNDPMTTWCS